MKIVIIIILILFTIVLYCNEYYYFNLRQTLKTDSPINYPILELFLNSKYDSTANIHFYCSFFDFYPYDFVLKMDSLRIAQRKFSVFIGDKLYYYLNYLKFRGIGFNISNKPMSLKMSFGQSKDFISIKYPVFQHNKFIFISHISYSFSKMDSTILKYVKRVDDSIYNNYTDKNYFILINKFKNSNIRFFSNIKYGLYNNDTINYNKIAAKYSFNMLYTKFSLNIAGEYIPSNFITLTNITYSTGNFNNNVSLALKITDELSVYAFYNNVMYLLNPFISHHSFGLRTGMKIPILPHINMEINMSRYIYTNQMRSLYWRIGAYKRLKRFLISAYFLRINQISFSSSLLNTKFEYTMTNNAIGGLGFHLNHNDNSQNYRFSTFLRFKPIKKWNIEFGTDFMFSDDYFFVNEYILNSFNFNNFYISIIGALRFRERTYASLSLNFSTRDKLKDINLAMISGRVFIDNNNNGELDKTEKGLNNIYVLLNDTIKLKTNNNGYFSKYFMKPGKYRIKIVAPDLPAYYNMSGNYTVELNNIGKTNINIPIIKMGSISGYVFFDINKNGIKEKEEPGISNVLVSIKNSNIYTYTNSEGFYMFSNINRGNYIIEIMKMPTGYTLSIPGIINYVTVKDIKADYTIDFGLTKQSKPVIKKIF